MASTHFTLNWGILATGGIARQFTKDLLIDPRTRDVRDVSHRVVAVASSSSVSRAEEFVNDLDVPTSSNKKVVTYGNYKDLVADANVNIIYVATPHSHHYQHIRLALEAGKHVLAEKPITVNAEQCKAVMQLAKEKNLFLMEAVWTRFFPLSREVVQFIKDGKLGEIKRVYADLSFWTDIQKDFGDAHRMVNKDLAGGVLLDLGIYSLTWVFQALYHTQPADKRTAPTVVSAVSKYPKTGCDEQTTVLLDFGGTAHAIATTSISVGSKPNPAHESQNDIRIQGTLGDLLVNYAPRPRTYTLIPAWSKSRGTLADFAYETKEFDDGPGGGHGMFWEADECARCIRDGKLESEVCGLEETLAVMKVMDEVRKQHGLDYKEELESLEYPIEGLGM